VTDVASPEPVVSWLLPRHATGAGRDDGRAPGAGEVYLWLAPSVLGYLRARGAADPEDLLGEVFFQVARDIDRFRGDPVKLRAWVFRITRNRLIDDARRRSARPQSVSAEVPEPTVEPSAPVDPELLDALAQLTPAQREVVLLRFVADLPVAEVARLVRRRPGAVKAMQSRALARLQQLLGQPA
jgi:RNA polymerase sigma-70 factor, ECF subfamily